MEERRKKISCTNGIVGSLLYTTRSSVGPVGRHRRDSSFSDGDCNLLGLKAARSGCYLGLRKSVS